MIGGIGANSALPLPIPALNLPPVVPIFGFSCFLCAIHSSHPFPFSMTPHERPKPTLQCPISSTEPLSSSKTGLTASKGSNSSISRSTTPGDRQAPNCTQNNSILENQHFSQVLLSIAPVPSLLSANHVLIPAHL